ncbi:DUF397 domain-containing protein [Streptomyces sp. T-3]|nr:DUF397 domain-containing protein [Streptomyces sp. T-3]
MSSPLTWQKSSFSGGGSGDDCVELAAAEGDHVVHLRESESAATVLSTSRPVLQALLGAIKASCPHSI